ncbi:hypothetical protein CQA66_09090 [Helicobacter aurati]|uniref:Uncharacterized protein n=1 Tax=Helicobacter aurati TaxID=137778 RepID=A0A3D8IUG0_9HELI|nr:hypothetical protein [Helicobacter aurati]RDU68862.1 hypothetical protein CQA66_09090 [Helicobacter aurati]
MKFASLPALLVKNRARGTTAPACSDFSHHEVGADSTPCHSEGFMPEESQQINRDVSLRST